jgi:protein SCO1/2
MNSVMQKRVVLAVAAVVAVVVVALLARQWLAERHASQQLPVNTRMGGDFILPSTLGQPLDTRTLRGKVVLLNFGFASCPDVCPLVLARMKAAVKALGDDAESVQGVFVSFDPARDTVANLKVYVEHFHPGFIGATGSEAEIAAVAARYGVVYLKENTGSASGYGFAHSDYIYLLDAEGHVRKLYGGDAKTDEIARDIRLLQAADRSLF